MIDKKSRCWWFVQKIENMPENWRELLEEMVMPCAYIVHDKDWDYTDEGEQFLKDNHIHCIMEFGSPVRFNSALNAIPYDLGVKMVKPVGNKVGAYRYLLHYGLTDKYNYSDEEVVKLYGFNVNLSNVYDVDFTNIYQLIGEMKISSFAVLLAFCVEFKPEYVNYISSHVNLIKSYLAELR